MSSLSIENIIECLPHRYPFLLIDRVESVVPNSSLVAIKNVTANENFFQGHFPQKAVMPGVLILESLAQATGVLIWHSENDSANQGLYYLLGINEARFKKPVVPGDQLKLEVVMERKIKDIYKFKGTATVDGEMVARAEILTTGQNQ